jgi:hypothetical protein
LANWNISWIDVTDVWTNISPDPRRMCFVQFGDRWADQAQR